MKTLIKTKTAKTIYFLTGLLTITVIAFLAMTNSKLSASDEDAKIFFETLEHDFGSVQQGTALEYSFKFINEGDKPLVIESVRPACGCTGAATDGKSEYAGGESGEIKITFNTQGREGHTEKSIAVSTNDTLNSQINLKFKCDVTK
ncbi:MAG: DUF1573 domain-containing protein [bacterium]